MFRITPAAAATATITSNGKSFNIFRVVGNATGTVTLADALTCAKLTDSTGIFNSATYTIRADTLEIFSTAATTLSSSKCVYYNKTTGVGVSITQTSTIDTAKGGTITTNGITQPKIVMAGTAVAYNGGGTLTDLVMSPAGGDTVIWQTLKKVSFSTQPTLDGIAGARNHWVCSNAAGRDTIDLPAKDTLKYFYIRNQYFVDTVLCRRSDSCFSGGGNY